MGLPEALILGIIQGLTEFLPVSSSGHLVLGEALLGIHIEGIAFEVAVHLGTAGAVVLAYRKRIWAMLKALKLIYSPSLWKASEAEPACLRAMRENFLLDVYIIVGTIPAGVVGLTLKDKIEGAFNSPRLTCLMLMVTGIILLFSRICPKEQKFPLSWWRSLTVGAAQACALLPGISRSGTTITAGLALGLGPGKAAEFSFLLALPAIFGAAIVEVVSSIGAAPSAALPGLGALALGTAAAFFSGYAAIFILLQMLQQGKFDRFAYYCLAVGIAGYLSI
ncbi:MAG: undecaprenyl-diphosphate phosphatase [Gemmatimonadota bacterium]|nr:undecaprenyl-diphosphate phosphatase [Gemmatimonadota bacterium]